MSSVGGKNGMGAASGHHVEGKAEVVVIHF